MIDIAKGYSINSYPICNIQNKSIQPKEICATNKPMWKQFIYPSIGFVVGGALMGRFAYLKCNKNIKLKYAVFAKDKIKEFLKLPEAKPYVKIIESEKTYYEEVKNNPRYKEIIKGHKYFNFITYFKNLKRTLLSQKEHLKKQVPDNEDLLSMAEINQAITKIKIMLLDIEQAFIDKNINKTVNSCIKNSAIGGIIGAGFGIGANYLGNKNEN